jgi:GNAT superfamily N-acetyltransferase
MSKPDVIIREATREDIPQLLELYTQLNPDDKPVEVSLAADIWEKAVENGVTYFVADICGHIAGSCYIAVIPNLTRSGSSIGFIENVITCAEHRRRGVGRQLLEAAIRYAKEQGCYKVVLQSGNKRKEAHEFYESVGFDGDSKRAFEIRF